MVAIPTARTDAGTRLAVRAASTPSGRRVERAEEHQAHDGRGQPSARTGGGEVGAHQQQVATHEHPLPPDAVGESAHRDGEREVRHVGADEEQREPRRREVVALLEGEVEEAVADGQDAQQRGGDDQPTHPRPGHDPDRRPDGYSPGVAAGPTRAQVGNDEAEDAEAEDGGGEGGHEDRGVVARDEPEDREGDKWPDGRPGRVEGPVDTERAAQRLGWRGGGDERVPRTRAQPLAEPVDGDDRRQSGEAVQGDEKQLGHRGDPVAREGHPLRPVGPVRVPAPEDPDQGTDTLVEAVDEPVGQRRQTDHRGEVDRQDRRDRLRRHVGQQADDTQQHDGGRDPPAGVGDGGAALGALVRAFGDVHPGSLPTVWRDPPGHTLPGQDRKPRPARRSLSGDFTGTAQGWLYCCGCLGEGRCTAGPGPRVRDRQGRRPFRRVPVSRPASRPITGHQT